MADEPLVPNRPSAEGRLLGEQLARLTDHAEPAVREKYPSHAERCKSCAFRAGTVPNGCLITAMDALKAVIEKKPFYCHQEFNEAGAPTELCAGWAIAMTACDGVPDEIRKIVADWEFSK